MQSFIENHCLLHKVVTVFLKNDKVNLYVFYRNKSKKFLTGHKNIFNTNVSITTVQSWENDILKDYIQ
jgi:hypothetical protein